MAPPLIIVQARAGGTRFPGKMLAPLLGQPLILWTLQRIARLAIPHRIIVAVPFGAFQDPLIALCRRHGYEVWQPCVPENDVLHRYWNIASQVAEYTTPLVRVTGDCPLIDAAVIEQCLQVFRTSIPDHVGIAAEWPDGMDCEVFSMQALQMAHEDAEAAADREHVTPYLWRHPERFRCVTVPCPMDLTPYQTSIDTVQDLLLAQGILDACLERYGFGFGWRDIWYCLEQHLHLKTLMLQRPPRNQSYVAQVGVETWEEARYGE